MMPNNDPQDEVFYLTLLIYSYFSHTIGIGISVFFPFGINSILHMSSYDEITQVRGWDFLVPQQYIMMDTFSRTLFDFLRFYMNSVRSAFFF